MDYKIPITKSITYDAASSINILLAGARGMGKSWLGMYLALKLAMFEPSTQLFIIDFKQSDASRLKALLPDNRVATSKVEIFSLMKLYVSLMRERADFVNKNAKFGATASTLEMPLFYLWYDEFGAFTPTLSSSEKKQHDELLAQITLLGRQYNFGLLAIMQQLSVTNSGVPTSVKEQMGMIIHMGAATTESYRQTFSNSFEIPRIKLSRGQGLIWVQGDRTIYPFSAPDLTNVDLWEAFKKALANQNDDLYLTMSNKL